MKATGIVRRIDDLGRSEVKVRASFIFLNVCTIRTSNFERINRIVNGHKTTVRYSYCITL